MSGSQRTDNPHPRWPRLVRTLSVPVILVWLAAAAATNILVPKLEVVGAQHAVSMSPQDAPSVIAMKHIGQKFGEFTSDSVVMIILESDTVLGDQAHRYYAGLVDRLRRDSAHVEHVQDFWGDRITSAGSQSESGNAAYVQVHLAGNQGSAQGIDSVRAVRDIVDRDHPPPGLRAYLTGQAAQVADTNEAGDKSGAKMTVVTVIVITLMLLIVYRSLVTTFVALLVVLTEMSMARGVVAVLGNYDLIGLSTFSVNVLTAMTIAAGTDYWIFLLGRYHEARNSGEDTEKAFYSTFSGVAHVILGSGLTIAGAMMCLRFTRLNYFNTLALPCAIAMLVTLTMALTFAPAVLTISSRFGPLDPKRNEKARGWRKLGTAVVRWPGPIFVVATALSLVGLAALPGYRTSYNNRFYIPDDVPSNLGYTAAEKHFTSARMNPDLLMVEADHDMRNPRDMLVLDRVAKNIFRIPGIARVQSITRPLGPPMEHGSVPYQISAQAVSMRENLQFLQARLDDTQTMTDKLTAMIAIMAHLHDLTVQVADATHTAAGSTHDMSATTAELRDQIADFDDFFRPLRSYFYWERHCYDIPACWAFRSLFDATDGFDKLADNTKALSSALDSVDRLTPQIADQLPPLIALSTTVRDLMLTLRSSFGGMITQLERMTDTAAAMGQTFDEAKNDDMFYLPPEAFDSPDFQRGMQLMLSPDGKAARFIVTHDVDPATPEGISHVDAELRAAKEAVKGGPLANAKFFLGGTAATYKDIQQGAHYDLLIAAIAAIILIFVVMVVITRALVAAMVIVGTVVLSLAASFGLSVLIWQQILGIELQWLVIVMAVIVLLAVGSDYNLLVVSRMKEEIGAGLKTGLIRAMGATGGVVTAAGLVFAFTMISMITNDLRSVGQIGTTIGLGLLFDTFVVRSLLTPSIAALLGRWFWWPMKIDTRPARLRRSGRTQTTGPAPAAGSEPTNSQFPQHISRSRT
ncbi:MMPL/RND family transporter [Mycobacterium shigaense]|uniref:Putative membrane protein, MmpL n=1 Tax=Mycobacterium shigaense TaxID=722731 RepID=A0A1Z4EJR1_9MYCO|nr:MMPL family transporter [Mycobacterium shigaense]BAX93194.1 putative membrane protein, MmpL [Mycobacterium shigaense]